jgi:hypothetical protein
MMLKRLLLAVAAGFVIAAMPVFGQTNGFLREVYTGIGGGSVAELTSAAVYPASPALEDLLTNLFEAPSDWNDSYGTRVRGLVTAPATGSYVFWIASDDGSQLFLSTNADPANKRLIASVNAWTASRAWTTEANQQSAAITLQAGQKYYIEALQKEGGGGDNLAVGWQLPDGTLERPMAASRAVPYGLGPPVITGGPQNISVVEGNAASFTLQLARYIGCTYQWQRNGTNVPGARAVTYGLSATRLVDSGSTFRCLVANPLGSATSVVATLTVTPDVTRPTLNSVGSVGDQQTVAVFFSEPVAAAGATNAANYTISGGVTVLGARFGTDARSIVLTTSPMALRTTYTLTVNNVRDLATVPNLILSNSQRTFSLDFTPADSTWLRPGPEPIGASSRRTPMVISEVMYHPTNRLDGRELEFVELYNSQPWLVELGGWRLSGAVDYVFPTNTVIGARSYLVVAASVADLKAVYGITNVLGPFANTNRLQNGAGTLRLRDSRDAILLEMSYTGDPPYPVAADGAGHSLVLARPSFGGGDPRAWAASDVPGGSPGRAETAGSNPYRTVVLNELLANSEWPAVDYLELYNYGNSPVNLAGCVLTDDPATNKFVFPTGTTLAAQGFLALAETQLGFALSSEGETVLLRAPGGGRVVDALRFGDQASGVALGRFPDGAVNFSPLQAATPGTNNVRRRLPEVVINEIMYEPISGDGEEEYVELFNRGTNQVDLGRWRLRGGISHTLPAGTILAPGGYLVIARNVDLLRSVHALLNPANSLGNFSGSLGNGGDRVALEQPEFVPATNALGDRVTNTLHCVVDEVTYCPGGRWPKWAAGGGSSLERRDPRADGRDAGSWADSDEAAKTDWVTVEVTGVLDNGQSDAGSLQILLLGAGECLVDNLEVIPSGEVNRVPNPTLDSDGTGYFFQGNHIFSHRDSTGGQGGGGCLHLVTSGRGDTGANRVRVPLTSALSSGQTATLRARVRWLKGAPQILLRLHGGWLEAPGDLVNVRNLGTPGRINSRATANAGPAITGVSHFPVLPAASEVVTVMARVQDPDGLASLVLKYRIEPSTNFTLLSMTYRGAGLFTAGLPGQVAGTMVDFHIEAMDNGGAAAAITLFPEDAPQRECQVRWGEPAQNGALGVYRVWVSDRILKQWVEREKMSNDGLDTTFVYGGSRVIYNMNSQYSGSPYHSPGYNSPVGNNCDYVLNFPADDRLLGEGDFNLLQPGNGGGDGTLQTEQQAYWLAGQMGLPVCYHRSIHLFINGNRRGALYEDSQQPNNEFVQQYYPDDPDGDLHKIQLWFEFDDAASGFSAAGASLSRYLTTGGARKLTPYRWNWAKRAYGRQANDYSSLFQLVETVNTSATGDAYTRALQAEVDVDQWYRTHVVEHIVGNNDSYSYGGGQNMFIYKPRQGPWNLLIWDIDFAFGSGDPTSDLFGIGGANVGPVNYHPPFARIYWQALLDAANGPLVAARANAVLDARYNAMVADGISPGSPQGIKDFIAQRRTYILGLVAANTFPFALTANGGGNFATNRNLITLTGTAPLPVRSLVVNGLPVEVTWTTLSNWTARVLLAAGSNLLQVQGLDSRGVPVAGAADTQTIQYTGAAESPVGRVVINEIMYHPVQPGAEFVELYNTSAQNAFDLGGWVLDGAGFTFPSGTVLEAGAYLVVAQDAVVFSAAYGSGLPLAGVFDGVLDNQGETLRLIKPGTSPALDLVVDQVTFDRHAPWPVEADGDGASLQLVDALRDNARVANWAAVSTNAAPPASQWRYATFTGTASSSALYIYLQSAGDVYLDDVKLVAGSVAEAGVNVLANGDFESTFPGPYVVAANHAGSVLTTVFKHGGGASLHVVASVGGSTRGSSICQDITPALASGQTYTLSFWYLPGANGGSLTFRLSGSGINASVSLSPGAVPVLARYTPGQPNSVRASRAELPSLWLNEAAPRNVTGAADRFGEVDPWVELYNGGSNTLSLAGCYLTDDFTNLLAWPFPASASVGAGQCLLVWADGEPSETGAGEWHASFRLAAAGGSVAVVSTNGGRTNVLDYLHYSVGGPDRSFGAYPDGDPGGRRELFIPTPGATNNPGALPLTVLINEWMADNSTTIADPSDQDFEDWFELYNPNVEAVDLSGCYLTDTLSQPLKWQIPPGVILPGNSFLLVWADNEPEQNYLPGNTDLHAGFQLSAGGEAIGLFSPNGMVQSAVTFGRQTPDVSEGRVPDGSPAISVLTASSPGSSNLLPPPESKTFNGLEAGLLTLTLGPATNSLGQPLQYVILQAPRHGTLTTNGEGGFIYTPAPFFNGVDAFQIAVTDGRHTSAPGQVTVNITPVNSVSPYLFYPASFTGLWFPPAAMVAGDLNADTNLDLAIASSTGLVRLLAGNGQGGWTSLGDLPTGGSPVALWLADVDRDAKTDVIVLDATNGTVNLWRHSSGTNFSSPLTITLGGQLTALAVADLNQDSRPDIVVTDAARSCLWVMLGNVTNLFDSPVVFPVGGHPSALVTADFTRDGRLDVVAACDEGLYLLPNSANTLFSPAVVIPGNHAAALAAGDFDHDGAVDLALADNASGELQLLLNNLAGSLTNSQSLWVGGLITALDAHDFTGDGLVDVALTDSLDSSLRILPGSTNGGLVTYYQDDGVYYQAGLDPVSLAAGDFNRDGLPDLVVANRGSQDFALYLSNRVPLARSFSLLTLEDKPVRANLGDNVWPLVYTLTQPPASGTLLGLAPDLTYVPNTNFFGRDVFQYTVTDGRLTSGVASVTIMVQAVNDAPVFSLAATELYVAEDCPSQTLSNLITGVRPGPDNEASQSLRFSASAGDPTLFTAQPLFNSAGTLSFTPARNRYGTTPITVRAIDTGGAVNGGVNTSPPRTLTLHLTNVNDTPSISLLDGLTVLEDQPATFALTVADQETIPAQLAFTVTADNPALVPPQGIQVSANGSNRLVTVSSRTNVWGKTRLTFTVSDGTNTSSRTTTLTVNPVNDAPAFVLITNQIVVRAGQPVYAKSIIASATMGPADESAQTPIYTMTVTANSLFTTPPTLSAAGILTLKPRTGTSGSVSARVTLRDSGGTAFGGKDTYGPIPLTITVQP